DQTPQPVRRRAARRPAGRVQLRLGIRCGRGLRGRRLRRCRRHRRGPRRELPGRRGCRGSIADSEQEGGRGCPGAARRHLHRHGQPAGRRRRRDPSRRAAHHRRPARPGHRGGHGHRRGRGGRLHPPRRARPVLGVRRDPGGAGAERGAAQLAARLGGRHDPGHRHRGAGARAAQEPRPRRAAAGRGRHAQGRHLDRVAAHPAPGRARLAGVPPGVPRRPDVPVDDHGRHRADPGGEGGTERRGGRVPRRSRVRLVRTQRLRRGARDRRRRAAPVRRRRRGPRRTGVAPRPPQRPAAPYDIGGV
ncbi:MAG: hypothetical protein AVDCRST_MAG32-2035, partial [uncultured Nocardioides sp.]